MEFSKLITHRYSVRGYTNAPVEDEKLQQILEAARMAPTAANRQPFQLIVIHTEGRKEELRRIYNKDWFVQAPLIIVACGLPSKAWVRHDKENFTNVDVSIVMDHLILAAADLELGTCWIGAFDPEASREIVGLPDDVEPIVMTPVGYPTTSPKTKQRKPLEELVRYERW
ncbi:MAG: nitroreductase family protein [Chloroflexota bacterium]|nr:nitroreductase family protein [Chloroflexota bacterium]